MTGFLPKNGGAFAATLALGAAGGGAAAAAGLPVAWLLGPVFVVSAATLAGLDTRMPDRLRDLVFFILGLQAGSGVTPDVLDQIALWPLSFAVQMIGVLFVIAATYGFLRLLSWDRQTALFSAIPGALSFVIAAASQTRADMTRITVLQSVRLLLLIGALAPALAFVEGGEGTVTVARGHAGTPGQYAILFGVSALAALLGHRSRLPGGMMLGALLSSAALHVTEIAPVPIPPFLAVPSLVLLGITIGARLQGLDRRGVVALIPASLGSFAIGLTVAGLSAAVAVLLLSLAPAKVALAYAPGALEALTVLAFQFGQDPAYVAAHHVVRFMALALTMPFLARSLGAPPVADQPPAPPASDSGIDIGEDGR
ncbi:AbrB family transcriptional regulator [Aurantimonas sp. Leaf443]|uniref:AbrB family transcriptional regulator n=1 Tax=Aurantimonas sp. Leaf443 TaxID=1736378 RepID=UPI0006FDED9C|nr:AbrB family transcriptional regulator [Aurantimonas sp. Leaf443]KQT85778.1 ammonia monooxygenase [Aurantimonas sp. Leaf443]